MPIYEYLCQVCAHRFEVRQKFSDPPVETCVRCGKSVNRLISAPAIMFKGSGWYVTDYSDKFKAPTEAPSTNGQDESKKEASPASKDSKEKPAAAASGEAPGTPTATKDASPSPAPTQSGSSNSSGTSKPSSSERS